SSGGGRGGYSYGANNGDALTQAPGNAAWGGDNRQHRGGRGGRPLANDPLARLFAGGGGGAGDANNNAGGAGGAGGGIAYVLAGAVAGAGTGSILANGANGIDAIVNGVSADAPGGAGAGGTIVVMAPTVTGLTLAASGGR